MSDKIEPSTSEAETSGTPAEPAVSQDTKAAFAAALARKNAATKARSEHLDGENHVHGTSSPGVTKRQFRRKSG